LGIFDGLSTATTPAVVDQDDAVFDRRRRGDQLLAELALEPLLDDLHVEQAQEAAAEAEAERDRALGLEAEAGVVEVELLHRLAQDRVVRLALQRGRCRRRRGSWPAGSRAADAAAGCATVVTVSPTWASRTLLRPVAT
jgi:hypothetical protein